MDDYKIFRNGSAWLRADFHLHTKADREFAWEGDDNQFVSRYVEALKAKDIKVGVIANHNKFDREEFKMLCKEARKQEIYLLPGMELSVKEGTNGIHKIVIFSEQWINNKENTDYVEQFLSVTFAGQANYDSENARSNHDLLRSYPIITR